MGNAVGDDAFECVHLILGNGDHMEPVAGEQTVVTFSIWSKFVGRNVLHTRFVLVFLVCPDAMVEQASSLFPLQWTMVSVQLSHLPAGVDAEILI